jgi:hypothetical protein
MVSIPERGRDALVERLFIEAQTGDNRLAQ